MSKENSFTIEDLIPHRKPMRLIDALLELGEKTALASAVVTEDWPMSDEKGVPGVLTVELIAQTAATIIGWQRRSIEKMGGRGLLVGIKEATFPPEPLPIGEELLVRVTIIRQMENYCVFEGEVLVRDQIIAKAVIQALRP